MSSSLSARFGVLGGQLLGNGVVARKLAVDAEQRCGADLEVQVGALFRDELTQGVLDIEHIPRDRHRRAGLERRCSETGRAVRRLDALRDPRRAQATSRSFWASARLCSFFSDWFSIWRIRSRVTLNVRPTSSSVRGCSPPSP